MSNESLLKMANDKRPADFTKEFKANVDVLVKQSIYPVAEEKPPEEKITDEPKDGEGESEK